MRTDESMKSFRNQDDQGQLGNFGDATPTNSFSGGEVDHLFLNHHGEQFYDLGAISGLADAGDGRTFGILDYDRDGWIDFVLASANAPTFQLYRNLLGETHHRGAVGGRMIALRFVGGNTSRTASRKWSARNGYGAVVHVEAGGATLVRELRCGEGRAAQNSATMIVGIGDGDAAQRIVVRWPSGMRQEVRNVLVGNLVTIYEKAAQSPTGKAFVIEPYQRNALADRARPSAAAPDLPLSLPADGGAARIRVLTAMTTTCKTCKAAQPRIARLRDAFAPGEIAIYGISTDPDDTRDDLTSYVAQQQPEYDVLIDLSLEERMLVREHVLETFRDDITPVSILVDAQGRILRTMANVPSISDVRRAMDRAENGY